MAVLLVYLTEEDLNTFVNKHQHGSYDVNCIRSIPLTTLLYFLFACYSRNAGIMSAFDVVRPQLIAETKENFVSEESTGDQTTRKKDDEMKYVL